MYILVEDYDTIKEMFYLYSMSLYLPILFKLDTRFKVILSDARLVDSFNILNSTSIISLMLKVILCLPRGVCVYHRITKEIVSPTNLT